MPDNLELFKARVAKALEGTEFSVEEYTRVYLAELDRAFEDGLLVQPYEIDHKGDISVQLNGGLQTIDIEVTFTDEKEGA